MGTHRNNDAAAPGLAAPERLTNNEALTGDAAQGFKGQGVADKADCARKTVATATARAALLGIECRPLAGGAWLLRHARGADIGIVHGLPALQAAVAGFESACDDVADLVRRLARRAA